MPMTQREADQLADHIRLTSPLTRTRVREMQEMTPEGQLTPAGYVVIAHTWQHEPRIIEAERDWTNYYKRLQRNLRQQRHNSRCRYARRS